MANPIVTPQAAGLDYQAIGAAVAGVVAFVGIVIAGFRQGLKTIKDLKLTPDGRAQIAAGVLMETSSINAWTESNREVAQLLHKLVEVMEDHRMTLKDHGRDLKDHADELRDMRRQIDELQRKLG